MTSADQVSVRIEIVAVEPVRDDVLDRDSLNLRGELLAARFPGVRQAGTGPGERGARGGGMLDLGVLLVSLAPAVPVATKFLDVLNTWLAHRPARRIRIETHGRRIEIESASRDEIARLITLLAEDEPKE